MKFVVLLFGTLASAISGTYAVACTPAQLKGNFNSFRTTGGSGNFNPGTTQVVSYDNPQNTSVQALTGVTIVPNGANSPVFNPAIVSGVPQSFNPNVDFGGSVQLILPPNLPAGSFVYRLALTTTTGACTFDSQPFGSTGVSPNQCNIGESRCVAGGSGFQNCVSSAGGNIFGPIQNCTPGTSCTQAGNQALCTSGNPSVCTAGAYRCAGTGYQICLPGAGGINSFSPTFPCGPGTACQQQGNSIVCGASSVPPNQCSTLGERRCSSTGSFQTCILGPQGNFIFSAPANCPAGTSCTGSGICSSSFPSTCSQGVSMFCEGISGFRQCIPGATGAAPGPFQACGPSTTCHQQGNFISCF